MKRGSVGVGRCVCYGSPKGRIERFVEGRVWSDGLGTHPHNPLCLGRSSPSSTGVGLTVRDLYSSCIGKGLSGGESQRSSVQRHGRG